MPTFTGMTEGAIRLKIRANYLRDGAVCQDNQLSRLTSTSPTTATFQAGPVRGSCPSIGR